MAKSKPKTVLIRIRAAQRVRYDQIISMTADEWAAIKAKSDSEATVELQDRLDLGEVCDADDIEDCDLEAERVGDDGKSVKPPDVLESPDD